MNLQNLFGCHEILQSRGLLNTNSVAFPICVDCRYLEHERWGDVTNRQNTPSKVRKRAYERFPRAIRATFHALYLVAPGEMHQSLLLPGRLRKLKKKYCKSQEKHGGTLHPGHKYETFFNFTFSDFSRPPPTPGSMMGWRRTRERKRSPLYLSFIIEPGVRGV